MGFPGCGIASKYAGQRLFQGEVWASPYFFCVLRGNFVQDDLHGVKWCGTLCCTAMRQWPNLVGHLIPIQEIAGSSPVCRSVATWFTCARR